MKRIAAPQALLPLDARSDGLARCGCGPRRRPSHTVKPRAHALDLNDRPHLDAQMVIDGRRGPENGCYLRRRRDAFPDPATAHRGLCQLPSLADLHPRILKRRSSTVSGGLRSAPFADHPASAGRVGRPQGVAAHRVRWSHGPPPRHCKVSSNCGRNRPANSADGRMPTFRAPAAT